MRFLLIIAHDHTFQADTELIGSILEWIETQSEAGVRISGAPLTPPDQARTVEVRDGTTSISEQPFTPGPLHTAAFEMIECADLDVAVAIAATHPMSQRATIEVRPIWSELEGT